MSDKEELTDKMEDQIEENEELTAEDIVDNEDLEQEGTGDEPTTEELVQKEKDRYLRLFAEFENYKKRTSRERIEMFKTANEELMTVLLPILDDFDRGLAEISKAKDINLLKGMELINSKLKNVLRQKGLSKIEVKEGDVFDAEIHEAITQIPAPSKKLKGKVIDVTEKGYKLGDKIIRYPKVVIGQ